MKEHAKKIGEGFSGLFHDLRKHLVHISKKIHLFLGKTGWILIGTVLVIRILLATYTHRIERARFGTYIQYNKPYRTTSWRNDGRIHDMYRDIERMQERMERTRAYYDKIFNTIKFPTNTANYQKYFRSESGKGTTSLTYDQGKIEGFAQRKDEQTRKTLAQELQKAGLSVNENDATLFFSGETKTIEHILPLLQE